MKPVDVRNGCFREIQDRLVSERRAVYEALLGLRGEPVTARRLAEKMGRDVLSVAPRLTELVQLGLAWLCGREGRRGLYEAIPLDHVRAACAARGSEQPALKGLES